MNRSLAVLGAAKSLQNARELLEDSKLLLKQGRYGTSYALAIFALEEIAKGFVFHWVADGALTETDLRKLIYRHRSKHAIIPLFDIFEKGAQLLLSKLEAVSREGHDELTSEFTEDEMKKLLETARKAALGKELHLLIHAQRRREISLYIGICERCKKELLGPWLITASDADELLVYVEKHLVKIESFVRNCKRHERGIETRKTAQLQPLVRQFEKCLEVGAASNCQHVLCSDAMHVSERQQARER
jgi:AbiV family abortive infection protein